MLSRCQQPKHLFHVHQLHQLLGSWSSVHIQVGFSPLALLSWSKIPTRKEMGLMRHSQHSTNSASPICASVRFDPGPSYYNYLCNPYSTNLDVKTSSINQNTWRGGIPRFTGPAFVTFTTNSTSSASSTTQASVTVSSSGASTTASPHRQLLTSSQPALPDWTKRRS